MRSHAAVWSCHVLVLRLLWSSTGVTIIMPKVLIIYRETERQEKTESERKGLGVWCNPLSLVLKVSDSIVFKAFSILLLYPETFVSIFLLSVNGIGLPQKIPVRVLVTELLHHLVNLMNCEVSTGLQREPASVLQLSPLTSHSAPILTVFTAVMKFMASSLTFSCRRPNLFP